VISSSSVLVGAARGRSEIVFVKKYEWLVQKHNE
jgi:hypothetical protein